MREKKEKLVGRMRLGGPLSKLRMSGLLNMVCLFNFGAAIMLFWYFGLRGFKLATAICVIAAVTTSLLLINTKIVKKVIPTTTQSDRTHAVKHTKKEILLGTFRTGMLWWQLSVTALLAGAYALMCLSGAMNILWHFEVLGGLYTALTLGHTGFFVGFRAYLIWSLEEAKRREQKKFEEAKRREQEECKLKSMRKEVFLYPSLAMGRSNFSQCVSPYHL